MGNIKKYIRFIRDVKGMGYTIKKNSERLYEGYPDRLSETTYSMCCGHGIHMDYEIGKDCIVVNKKITIIEEEI